MRWYFPILTMLALAGSTRAEIVSGSTSPDGRLAITEIKRDYYFFDLVKNRRLESVLPPGQRKTRDHITNVGIENVRWNKDSSAVAFVLYYGAKMSDVVIFRRAPNGSFALSDFEHPDPFTPNAPPEDRKLQPSYEEYAVGAWEDKNTVRVLAGSVKTTSDAKEDFHFLITYKVTIAGKKAVVGAITPLGRLTGDKGVKFFEAWTLEQKTK